MRRAAALLLAATSVLAGCGGGDEEPTRTPAQVSADAADYAFGEYVKENDMTQYGDMKALRDLAASACRTLDRDVQWIDMLKATMDAGFTARDAGGFIGASVAAYCPEHKDALPPS